MVTQTAHGVLLNGVIARVNGVCLVSPPGPAPAFTVDTKPQRLRRDVVALLLLLARQRGKNRRIIGAVSATGNWLHLT